jgi:hypothetical protein
MKPLSMRRKAVVSIAFFVGVVSLVYGFIGRVDWALRLGKYSLLGFLVLFALLILPYWGSDPKLGSELVN